MKKRFTAAAFSLVEVVLALGIAAFCLIAVFGLLPVAALTNRNATSQTAARNVMTAVVADLRTTPKDCALSSQFGIRFGTPPTQTLYFDGQGQSSCDPNGLQKYQYIVADCSAGTCSGSWSPALQPRYRLTVTWAPCSVTCPVPCSVTCPVYADVKVSWPAAAALANVSGSVEMFAAFDRN